MNSSPSRRSFVDRLVDVSAPAGDVLDPFALVVAEVLLDLALFVGALVDRDADLAAGACHGARVQACELALDVEVADLAEVEKALVPVGPPVHAAALDIMRKMVDIIEAGPFGFRLALAGPAEIDIPDRALLAVTVDEIDERAADSLRWLGY